MSPNSLLPRKLHIGCFDCPVEGWHNTDITPHLWIARIPFAARVLRMMGRISPDRYEQHRRGVFRQVHYLDLSKPFPYPDGSFDFVFSCHVFEHIPRPVLKRTLKEIRRVLAPGGTVRVVIPDLGFFVRNYTPETADEFVRGVFEIDHGMEKNRHQWMYSDVTLRRLLEDAGYENVTGCRYRQGKCPDLDRLDNRPDHSIFMEADKPDGRA